LISYYLELELDNHLQVYILGANVFDAEVYH